MEEFVKPKRIVIPDNAEDQEYIKNLVEANFVKDLHDNEELCHYCHGTGMTITDNVYGLSEDPDRKVRFPYKHQALTFCPHCYNGIVRRCKLCGEIMQRGYLKHDCEQQKAIDRKLCEEKKAEAFEKAPLLPEDKESEFEYFFSEYYSSNNGYFSEWDEFFDDWYECHSENEIRPEYVWVTESEEMHIDAHDIVESATENLYEDAYDDVSNEEIKRLQAFLDDWTKTCGVSRTYYESHKYKVRIPWEKYGQ